MNIFYFEDEYLKSQYSREILIENTIPSSVQEVCFVKKTPPHHVDRIIRSVYKNSKYEIVELGKLLKKAVDLSVPLAKDLLDNCHKISNLMYLIVPEENSATRNIGGFSDGEITVVAIRKVGLRNIFKSAQSFVDSLTPNAYTYIVSIMIHELNHHVCGYSDKIFKKYKFVFEKFLSDVIDRAYIDSRQLKRYYSSISIIPERVGLNNQIVDSLVKTYITYGSNPELLKDKQLGKEIAESVKALSTGSSNVVKTLQHSRGVQDTIYNFYNSLLKVDSRLKTITFGQELIVPSEITSVISQFAVYNVPLSRQVATDVLKLL
ncbi:MAG: hypothetical protein QW806_09805 [Nitrososphaerota archaeon]